MPDLSDFDNRELAEHDIEGKIYGGTELEARFSRKAVSCRIMVGKIKVCREIETSPPSVCRAFGDGRSGLPITGSERDMKEQLERMSKLVGTQHFWDQASRGAV